MTTAGLLFLTNSGHPGIDAVLNGLLGDCPLLFLHNLFKATEAGDEFKLLHLLLEYYVNSRMLALSRVSASIHVDSVSGVCMWEILNFTSSLWPSHFTKTGRPAQSHREGGQIFPGFLTTRQPSGQVTEFWQPLSWCSSSQIYLQQALWLSRRPVVNRYAERIQPHWLHSIFHYSGHKM